MITAHIEVAYRRRKGRVMNVYLAGDAEEKPGSITAERTKDGLIQLKLDTKDGGGSAWAAMSSHDARTLRDQLNTMLGE
jgi:hypothetical protein